ncbi:hypothetical protein BJX65DRAFT_275455 [Aspergillus insuetus]
MTPTRSPPTPQEQDPRSGPHIKHYLRRVSNIEAVAIKQSRYSIRQPCIALMGKQESVILQVITFITSKNISCPR